MKLKKLLATVLTGVMVITVPVIAGISSGPATLVVSAAGNDARQDGTGTDGTGEDGDNNGGAGNGDNSGSEGGDNSENGDGNGEGGDNSGSDNDSSTPSSPSTGSSAAPTAKPAPAPNPEPVKSEEEILEEVIVAERVAAAEADAQQAAQIARETGIPTSVSVQAEDENKSVGEYMNNAVTELPGLTDLTPVAQGGKVIINGAPTNQSFSVQKPLTVQVQAAQAQAAALGGNIMNVTNVKGSVSFDTATVNFYMPGVTAGQNIQVYQLKDGAWNSVTVSEIREDHVVVDMTSYGVLAFIEVPVQ